MLTGKVHVFSDSRPRDVGFDRCFKNSGEESSICYDQKQIARTETTLQFRQLTLNGTFFLVDTSVQLLQKVKAFMSETGHEPESFRDTIIFASMFSDITNWASQKVQAVYDLLQVNGTKLALRMIGEHIICKHGCSGVRTFYSLYVLMRRKKGGGVGTHFKLSLTIISCS